VLSLGRFEHVDEKLTGALNPFDPLTVSIVIPVAPGALIFTVGGANETLKSGPEVTVKLADPCEDS
jgi:hypothetical protein